jgi:hypothetical protein
MISVVMTMMILIMLSKESDVFQDLIGDDDECQDMDLWSVIW